MVCRFVDFCMLDDLFTLMLLCWIKCLQTFFDYCRHVLYLSSFFLHLPIFVPTIGAQTYYHSKGNQGLVHHASQLRWQAVLVIWVLEN